ncbi:MAG: hypothetical protein WBX81_10690 [Nitrososphaeraceae archaeon]
MWALYEITYIEAKNTRNKQTDVDVNMNDVRLKVIQDLDKPVNEIIKRVREMEKKYGKID